MKKLTICLIVLIIVVFTFTLTGCNLLNNGSVDELEGIYGVNRFHYNSVDRKTVNYAIEYDYYLLVINGDGNGKVYAKPVDEEETSYDFTYTPVYGDSRKPEKVTAISVSSFDKPTISIRRGASSISFIKDAITFSFYPKREDLQWDYKTFGKNKEGTIVLVSATLEFNKIYSSVSDKRIERAKEKQTEDRENRTST